MKVVLEAKRSTIYSKIEDKAYIKIEDNSTLKFKQNILKNVDETNYAIYNSITNISNILDGESQIKLLYSPKIIRKLTKNSFVTNIHKILEINSSNIDKTKSNKDTFKIEDNVLILENTKSIPVFILLLYLSSDSIMENINNDNCHIELKNMIALLYAHHTNLNLNINISNIIETAVGQIYIDCFAIQQLIIKILLMNEVQVKRLVSKLFNKIYNEIAYSLKFSNIILKTVDKTEIYENLGNTIINFRNKYNKYDNLILKYDYPFVFKNRHPRSKTIREIEISNPLFYLDYSLKRKKEMVYNNFINKTINEYNIYDTLIVREA